MTAAEPRPNYAREIRFALTDPLDLCEKLGLLRGRGTFTRQAGGVLIRCPVHEDRSPSCSVRRAPDGTIGWRCHACDASGDALTLIAVVHGLSTRRDFRAVLRAAAELAGLWAVVHELDTGEVQQNRPAPPPPPKPAAPRDYPPATELRALWSETVPVTDDGEVAGWLEGRGLEPDAVAADNLARALPVGAPAPWWASYQRTPWTKTGHRLLVVMRDSTGRARSVRACRVIDGDSPKRLPPGGHRATDLVMACPFGTAMLVGTAAPPEVVVVEGEPDFLTWATRRTERPTARVGIVNGSWSVAMAMRFPPGAAVWIRTDHDKAGNKYAEELARTLRWRGCFVHRGGRADA